VGIVLAPDDRGHSSQYPTHNAGRLRQAPGGGVEHRTGELDRAQVGDQAHLHHRLDSPDALYCHIRHRGPPTSSSCDLLTGGRLRSHRDKCAQAR